MNQTGMTTVLYMTVSPAWKAETISLLVDKVLKKEASSDANENDLSLNVGLLPGQIRVTKILDTSFQDNNDNNSKKKRKKCTDSNSSTIARLEFASSVECKQILDSYHGLAIPHTHGYHHYEFYTSWPPPEPQLLTVGESSAVAERDDSHLSSSSSVMMNVPSPPLHLQLMAIPTKELQRRVSKLRLLDNTNDDNSNKNSNQDVSVFLKRQHQKCKVWIHSYMVRMFMKHILSEASVSRSRSVHSQEGVPVSKKWTNQLWQTLQQIPPATGSTSSNIDSDKSKSNNNERRQNYLSWPPLPKQRKGVQSSHYLTVRRQHPPYQDGLWDLCFQLLMETLGGSSLPAYNALAITKNFFGSPHIDAHDQTFQHVIAVGDFKGGRLCCEYEDDGLEELQICIHNRLGRMDGRKVHWVSEWEGTERYSVVYYSTNKQDYTEPLSQKIHVKWIEKESARIRCGDKEDKNVQL